MALPASSNFTLNAGALIKKAYQIGGKIRLAETLSTAQNDDGREKLQLILQSWQSKGIYLWALEEQALQLSASTVITGSDSLTYECILAHTSATATNKPITGTQWQKFWGPTGLTTSGAWANGQSYVSSGDYAVDLDTIGIWEAKIRDNYGYDHPLQVVNLQTLRQFPDRAAARTTWPDYVAFYFAGGATSTSLSARVMFYPLPTNLTSNPGTMLWTKIRRLQDLDSTADNPDAPERWFRAILYALADDLADDLKLPLTERAYIRTKATTFFQEARDGMEPLEGNQEEFVEPGLDFSLGDG